MPEFFWQIFNKNDLPAVRDFLKTWEYRNVNVSRYFFKARTLFNLPKPYPLYLCKAEDRLTGLLLKGPYGLFLPIFSENIDFSDTGIPVNPNDFRTLLGAGNAIQSAESHFPGRIRQTVNYRLMSMPSELLVPAPSIPPDIQIRRAVAGDLKQLFPLQQAYEMEEVILDPSTFNPLLCLENLRQQLKKEIIFIAEKNGVPIAKAGTNAQGLFYAQLGGIYTHPKLRNRGLSRAITGRLLKELAEMGLTACLFAKPDNIPALSVYRNCGMEDMGDFRISYLSAKRLSS